MFDRNEIRLFIGITCLCIAGLVVLYLGHPSEYSVMPRCPFYLLTGLYCPGCGSLRATHYLLHGNLSASVRNHPFFIPLMVFVLFLCGKKIYEFRRNKPVSIKNELLYSKILLIFVILFFAARNIPFTVLDWMRPPEPAVKAE